MHGFRRRGNVRGPSAKAMHGPSENSAHRLGAGGIVEAANRLRGNAGELEQLIPGAVGLWRIVGHLRH